RLLRDTGRRGQRGLADRSLRGRGVARREPVRPGNHQPIRAKVTLAETLTRGRPLGVDVDRVQGLAGGHEEAVPLGAPEADVAADLRDADPSDELAFRGPDGHAAVAHGPTRVARAPHVAVDVAAGARRPAPPPRRPEGAEQ